MAIKVQAACPKCGQQYSVADNMAGRPLRCGKCGASFMFRGPAGSAAPTPSAEGPGAGPAGRDTAGDGEAAAHPTVGDGQANPGVPPSGSGATDGVPATIGPFQVRKKLGQGAFGVVYHGYHPFLKKEVAVKVLRAEALSSPQSVQRFEREAQVLAQMRHPNVPHVYDAGKHGNDYYIASDYIAGKDLTALIPEGGMEPARAVRLVLQMLRALGYAHELGIVHRDVKPSNARVDGRDTLFLMDFGLASWAAPEAVPAGDDARRLTRSGMLVGTPAYMAPEQASGLGTQAGPAADLYAAGVVLYELLTGRLPFEGDSLVGMLYAVVHTPPTPPSHYRPRLDARLEAVCLRALAKRPEDRYRSAAEFAATLEDWQSGKPVQPAPVEPLDVLPVEPAAPPSAPKPAPAPVPVKVSALPPVPVAVPATPRGPAAGRRRLGCFDHPDAPAAHRCAECGEAFCAACLVPLRGRWVCGPCKNHRVGVLERQPLTSLLAILTLVLGVGGAAFDVCLTWGQLDLPDLLRSLKTPPPDGPVRPWVLALVGLCLPLLTLATGTASLYAVQRTPKLAGRGLVGIGFTAAGLAALLCLLILLRTALARMGSH
jgi:serine/threonine protein kinase